MSADRKDTDLLAKCSILLKAMFTTKPCLVSFPWLLAMPVKAVIAGQSYSIQTSSRPINGVKPPPP